MSYRDVFRPCSRVSWRKNNTYLNMQWYKLQLPNLEIKTASINISAFSVFFLNRFSYWSQNLKKLFCLVERLPCYALSFDPYFWKKWVFYTRERCFQNIFKTVIQLNAPLHFTSPKKSEAHWTSGLVVMPISVILFTKLSLVAKM